MSSITECIHCHKCRENCDFLRKYSIDIGDIEELKKLAFHCFLCGTCTHVCPLNIDGRGEILNMRAERAKGAERAEIEKKHARLLREKKNYIFRNYRNAGSGSVFFPGCNFPSLYPKTTDRISQLLYDNTGIRTVYDCCGKPVAELGIEDYEKKIIYGIKARIKKYGITEIVTACPNCKEYLEKRIDIPVISIYGKLFSLGLGEIIKGDRNVFVPCPDRYEQNWIDEIRPFVDGKLELIDNVQCCGLGGSAAVYEPDIAKSFADKIRRQDSEDICSYCASCTGILKRNGIVKVTHILSEIAGIEEKPDIRRSYINRAITKLK